MRIIAAMSLPTDDGASPREPTHELRFEDRGDYLRVEILGEFDSLDISIAYWREIAAECERRNTRALLAVDRLGGDPIPPEAMAQVIAVMRDSYMRHVRVAYCEMTTQQVSQAEYGELIAREAGYVVRVFSDEREAELWLRYGEDVRS